MPQGRWHIALLSWWMLGMWIEWDLRESRTYLINTSLFGCCVVIQSFNFESNDCKLGLDNCKFLLLWPFHLFSSSHQGYNLSHIWYLAVASYQDADIIDSLFIFLLYTHVLTLSSMLIIEYFSNVIHRQHLYLSIISVLSISPILPLVKIIGPQGQ